ncbi:MAG: fluoride efflux transporter CrcB [Candidatus Schekmanbacteria bacterium]|nr:fluoride efflux transporter CrcB [Candidatus Schekmanbacteria bacterium]
MTGIFLVGTGGFIGAVLRYLLSGLVQLASRSVTFPYGTLAVNVIGCFVMGLLCQLADARNVLAPETRSFLLIGVLGGFTTFSTFANETLNLARDGEDLLTIANISAHIFLGVTAVWAGRALAQMVWR